jgi:GNT-I family
VLGIRKGRQCIRPEISRTANFGEEGTSGGQFYHEYIKGVVLNEEDVAWDQMVSARQHCKMRRQTAVVMGGLSGRGQGRIVSTLKDQAFTVPYTRPGPVIPAPKKLRLALG